MTTRAFGSVLAAVLLSVSAPAFGKGPPALRQCQSELQSCTASLSDATGALQTCQTDLSSAQGTLTQCQSDLAELQAKSVYGLVNDCVADQDLEGENLRHSYFWNVDVRGDCLNGDPASFGTSLDLSYAALILFDCQGCSFPVAPTFLGSQITSSNFSMSLFPTDASEVFVGGSISDSNFDYVFGIAMGRTRIVSTSIVGARIFEITDSNLYEVNLDQVDAGGAALSGGTWDRVSLRGANLDNSNMYFTNISSSDLQGAAGCPLALPFVESSTCPDGTYSNDTATGDTNNCVGHFVDSGGSACATP